jgi:hypothetical protein
MSIYLDDKIPKMEFDNVIAKANKICESVWLKRKLEEEVHNLIKKQNYKTKKYT